MDVMVELDKFRELYAAKDYRTALDELHRLWDEIPEPKVGTSNAYWVLEYGVACAMKAGDLDEAQEWAALAPGFAQKRHDLGEVEFLIGKVAFERGELEVARQNFLVAKAKSRGRIFQGKDSKYKQLIK